MRGDIFFFSKHVLLSFGEIFLRVVRCLSFGAVRQSTSCVSLSVYVGEGGGWCFVTSERLHGLANDGFNLPSGLGCHPVVTLLPTNAGERQLVLSRAAILASQFECARRQRQEEKLLFVPHIGRIALVECHVKHTGISSLVLGSSGQGLFVFSRAAINGGAVE